MLEALLLALRGMYLFLSHVSTRSSFPLPMSPEEERNCIQRMQKGDEQARAELIERNLRLVAHVAKKYPNTGFDNDDLIGVGTIGLIKAVSTYNPATGTQLATYAARCIHNEILMALRAARKSKGDISLDEAIGADKEGNEIALIDILPSEDEDVTDVVDRRMELSHLAKLVRSELTPRERTVVELRYGLLGEAPMAQREVAKLLGISRSYISRIEKKALEKLKNRFERDEKML